MPAAAAGRTARAAQRNERTTPRKITSGSCVSAGLPSRAARADHDAIGDSRHDRDRLLPEAAGTATACGSGVCPATPTTAGHDENANRLCHLLAQVAAAGQRCRCTADAHVISEPKSPNDRLVAEAVMPEDTDTTSVADSVRPNVSKTESLAGMLLSYVR